MAQPNLTKLILTLALAMFVLIAGIIIVMLIARRQKFKQRLLYVETQNRLLETQFAALRSQMNPHFIFNCLNSIRLFTEQNNGKEASLYLGKIATLIRHTLDNARTERIGLDEELKSLELYLELESLRFKQKFSYTITVDSDVDKEFIDVPPLIIQPLAENAILHGLVHKPKGGNLNIHISYDSPEQDSLTVIIEDDGIGRKASATTKTANDKARNSYGMQITKERLEIMHKEPDKNNSFFTIEDLYTPGGIAAGTRVTLNLPLK